MGLWGLGTDPKVLFRMEERWETQQVNKARTLGTRVLLHLLLSSLWAHSDPKPREAQPRGAVLTAPWELPLFPLLLYLDVEFEVRYNIPLKNFATLSVG